MDAYSDDQGALSNGFTGTIEPSAIDGDNVAADLDSRNGLISHSSKRVKVDDSPSIGLEDEHEEDYSENYSEEGSGSGSESAESFVLDLFHAEGSEYTSGNHCQERVSKWQMTSRYRKRNAKL